MLKWLTRVFGHRKLWEGTGRRVTIETSLCDALLGCLEDGVLEVREVAQCVHLQAECSVFESLDLAQMNMHTQPALPHVLTLTRHDGLRAGLQTAMAAAQAMMSLAGPSMLLSRIDQVELEPKRKARLLQLAAQSELVQA